MATTKEEAKRALLRAECAVRDAYDAMHASDASEHERARRAFCRADEARERARDAYIYWPATGPEEV